MIILGVEEIAGRPSKLSPDPGEAIVIFDGRRATVLRTGERLTPGELLIRRRRKIVRVAASEQATTIDGSILASDGFRSFRVHLVATWRVTDFVAAATLGSFDIDAAIANAVEERLADLDRQFPLGQKGANAVYQYLRKDLEFRVIEFTEIIDVGGRVALDDARATHLEHVEEVRQESEIARTKLVGDEAVATERAALEERRRTLERESARRDAKAELKVEQMRKQVEREMALREAEVDRELALRQGEVERELALRQAVLDRKLERRRAELDVELLQKKLELYGNLAGTMTGLVSIQLAENPSQVELAIRGVREHQAVMAQVNLEAVKTMLDADAIEGFHLEEGAQLLIKRLLDFALGSINPTLDPRGPNELGAAEAPTSAPKPETPPTGSPDPTVH